MKYTLRVRECSPGRALADMDPAIDDAVENVSDALDFEEEDLSEVLIGIFDRIEFTDLVTISLNRCGVDVAGLLALADCLSAGVDKLTSISLNDNDISAGGVDLSAVHAFAEAVGANSSLTSLSMKNCKLTALNNAGKVALGYAMLNNPLSRVQFFEADEWSLLPADTAFSFGEGMELTPGDLVLFAGVLQANTVLKSLFAGENRYGQSGAAALAQALERNCTLEVIDLTRMHPLEDVGPAGGGGGGPNDGAALASLLATLGRHPSLRTVSLGENAIGTDEDAIGAAAAMLGDQRCQLNQVFLPRNALGMSPAGLSAIGCALGANRRGVLSLLDLSENLLHAGAARTASQGAPALRDLFAGVAAAAHRALLNCDLSMNDLGLLGVRDLARAMAAAEAAAVAAAAAEAAAAAPAVAAAAAAAASAAGAAEAAVAVAELTAAVAWPTAAFIRLQCAQHGADFLGVRARLRERLEGEEGATGEGGGREPTAEEEALITATLHEDYDDPAPGGGAGGSGGGRSGGGGCGCGGSALSGWSGSSERGLGVGRPAVPALRLLPPLVATRPRR